MSKVLINIILCHHQLLVTAMVVVAGRTFAIELADYAIRAQHMQFAAL